MNNRFLLHGIVSLCMLNASLHAEYTIGASVATDFSKLAQEIVNTKDITILPAEVQTTLTALANASGTKLDTENGSKLMGALQQAIAKTIRDASLFEHLDTTSAMDFADILIQDLLSIGINKQRPLTIIAARVRAIAQDSTGSVNPILSRVLECCRLVEELFNPGTDRVKPLMYYCDKFKEAFRDDDGNVVPGLEKLDQFFTELRFEVKFRNIGQIFFKIFGNDLNDPVGFAEKSFRSLLAVDPEQPYAMYCDWLLPMLNDENNTVRPELADLHAFLQKHRTSQHLAELLEEAQMLSATIQTRHQSTLEAGSNQYLAQWEALLAKMMQQYNGPAVITALQRRLAANHRYIQTRGR